MLKMIRPGMEYEGNCISNMYYSDLPSKYSANRIAAYSEKYKEILKIKQLHSNLRSKWTSSYTDS